MRAILTISLLGFAAAIGFAADKESTPADVEAAIQQGLKDFKAGRSADAIQSLQSAISMIQKSQQKGAAKGFPKAPAGWEAGKLESQSISTGSATENFAWTMLTQAFTRKSDNTRVNIELANSPQLIEPQKAMFENLKNPQVLAMMNQSPDTKLSMISQDGWAGMKIVEKQEAKIVAFCDNSLITITVNKADEAALETFWKAVDLKALAATLPKGTPKK